MNNKFLRNTPHLFRWIALVFFAVAIILVMVSLVFYSRERNNYPLGLSIGGVPVGGLNAEEATQRLLQSYNMPIVANVMNSSFQIDPGIVGFTLNTEAMIAAADLQRTGNSFWSGFWNYLWNVQSTPTDIPLVYSLNKERLVSYIETEVKTRYDQPSIPAKPKPGQTNFIEGEPGYVIQTESAVGTIEAALTSFNNRTVNLTLAKTNAGRPNFDNLQISITQIIETTPFDGVVGVYLEDLTTGEILHFGYNQNNLLPVEPDIAFTASSTIKIPILFSVYNRLGPELDQQKRDLITEMITKSENPASDALMEFIGGPLNVSEDMKNLGLENTFIGGYFYDGAPLLQQYSTPANNRIDVFTSPDSYNQTTPSDMGQLLSDIYKCSKTGDGSFIAISPTKFSKTICNDFLTYLKQDRIGVLIEAGLPEGTQIAHKHGWISGADGVIQNISDAGIIFTPNGDYILTIYVYHPVQTVWEPVSGMISKISEVVYNYFNLPK